MKLNPKTYLWHLLLLRFLKKKTFLKEKENQKTEDLRKSTQEIINMNFKIKSYSAVEDNKK